MQSGEARPDRAPVVGSGPGDAAGERPGQGGARGQHGRADPHGRAGLLALLKQTLTEIKEDRVLVMAGSLAYCAALSLAPLVIVTLGLVGLIADRGQVQQHVTSQVQGVLGPDGAELLGQIAESESIGAASSPDSTGTDSGSDRRGLIGTLAGLGALLFGATAVFVQLQNGLNTIWDVEMKRGRGLWIFVRRRLVSLAMVMSLGFLMLVSLLASTALSAATEWLAGLTGAEAAVGAALHVVVSLAVCTLLFALLFRFVPDARTAWRDTWLGAALTSVLFVAGEWAIGQYLGRAGVGSAYGAAGSLVVMLVWVYYSSLIVFSGAEFAQVYATQRGSGIVPARGARLQPGAHDAPGAGRGGRADSSRRSSTHPLA